MTVSKTTYTGSNRSTKLVFLSGTKAEVFQQLADEGIIRNLIIRLQIDTTTECLYIKG